MANTMIMDGSNARRFTPFRLLLVALLASSSSSFTPVAPHSRGLAFTTSTSLQSTVSINPADIVSKYEAQMAKMAEKDKSSTALSKDDIKVVHSDESIIVVEKPSGVLCVPDKAGNPSLNAAVFDAHGCESGNMDKMVVHRLGMDTSGLVVFAKTESALRFLNAQFRTRKVSRKYEALVCGAIEGNDGEIELPLMRDFENPPYMRVSSDDLQEALIDVDKDDLPSGLKKILDMPKDSITKYKVLGKEELGGHPVTRVELESVSGRTHQLNVHCAAIGHPIVKDMAYGVDGEAAKNGGVDGVEGVSESAQREINAAATGGMCVHMKELSFKHPVSKQDLTFESKAPF